jgi:hypothetical protein
LIRSDLKGEKNLLLLLLLLPQSLYVANKNVQSSLKMLSLLLAVALTLVRAQPSGLVPAQHAALMDVYQGLGEK